MAKTISLQFNVDALIQMVDKTNKLTKDKYITLNVFKIIENTPEIRKFYDVLTANYPTNRVVNSMIGKRVCVTYKLFVGKVCFVKGETTLAQSYRLLYKNEQEFQNDEEKE